jgi:hypothetical protein
MTNSFYTNEASATIKRLLGVTEASQDDNSIDVISELSVQAKSDIRMLLGLDESTLQSYMTSDAQDDILDFMGEGNYYVWYKKGEHGTFTEKKVENLNRGDATPAAPTTLTCDAGYTFNAWSPTVASTVTGNATYTATWTANTDTAYTVEYYYASSGSYPSTATSSANRTGTTGATASVTDDDKTPSDASTHQFDSENANNVLTGTIAGDGSLKLKVYFSEK